jgi:hypothetical protein
MDPPLIRAYHAYKQGFQIGFFEAKFQKSGFFKIWLASQNSFGFLDFSWRFYMLKLSARK